MLLPDGRGCRGAAWWRWRRRFRGGGGGGGFRRRRRWRCSAGGGGGFRGGGFVGAGIPRRVRRRIRRSLALAEAFRGFGRTRLLRLALRWRRFRVRVRLAGRRVPAIRVSGLPGCLPSGLFRWGVSTWLTRLAISLRRTTSRWSIRRLPQPSTLCPGIDPYGQQIAGPSAERRQPGQTTRHGLRFT